MRILLPLPRVETRDGRHGLIVDNRPFPMLGAQVNNSCSRLEYDRHGR
jgi:hypothetical protein